MRSGYRLTGHDMSTGDFAIGAVLYKFKFDDEEGCVHRDDDCTGQRTRTDQNRTRRIGSLASKIPAFGSTGGK